MSHKGKVKACRYAKITGKPLWHKVFPVKRGVCCMSQYELLAGYGILG